MGEREEMDCRGEGGKRGPVGSTRDAGGSGACLGVGRLTRRYRYCRGPAQGLDAGTHGRLGQRKPWVSWEIGRKGESDIMGATEKNGGGGPMKLLFAA
jgi:hypothetical protein